MKRIIMFIMLVMFLVYPVNAAWNTDTSIVNGLSIPDVFNAPTVFYKDSSWYLITGSRDGDFYGFNWTGSAWQSDPAIVYGLPDYGAVSYPKPEVYYKDGNWYLIAGHIGGSCYGFCWNGTGWEGDSSIVSGLIDKGSNAAPKIWNDSGNWKILIGGTGGVTYGYEWSGSTWVESASITVGDLGWASDPAIFNDGGIWKLIIGADDGSSTSYFYGYYWGGSNWIAHSSIVSGLPTGSTYITPDVFNDSGTFKLISGDRYGVWKSFKYTSVLANISGTVTNSTDHPIVGAEITVNTVPITIVTTNATGYYSIPNIDEYTYTITATAAGYGTYYDSIVAVGDVVKDFVMSETTYNVSGTITNSSGPVIGVNVTINGISDTTDVAGYYLISGLLPGIYTINATELIHDDYSDSVTIIEDNIVKNFEMVETTYDVSGTVTNSSGPVIGVNVTINGNSNTTNAIGYYLITGLLPDTYTITATAANHEDYSNLITVSEDTLNDFKIAGYIYDSFILTADILNAQNTAIQSINTIFDTIRPGNTLNITPSFNLTNSGNAPASVSATFTTFNESTYGLDSTSGALGGANFSLQKDSGTWNNLNNVNTGTSLTDTVLADNNPYNWNARLIIPAGQPGAVYTGTIELTFS